MTDGTSNPSQGPAPERPAHNPTGLGEIEGLRLIAEAIAAVGDPRETQGRLTELMAETIGASRCVFAFRDPATGKLEPCAPAFGADADTMATFRHYVNRPGLAESWIKREIGPFLSNDPSGLPPDQHENAVRLGIDNLLVAPMLGGKELLGAVLLANKAGGFSPEDARVAEIVGAQAAVSLRLVGLNHDLRRSDELFRALSENALSGVYLIQDGLFRYANPAFARVFGYTPQEICDRLRPEDLLVPEARSQVEEARKHLIDEGRTHLFFGTRALTKDGEEIEIEVRVFPVPYRGHRAVMGTLLDVTAERRAQRAAEDRQAEIEALYQASERLLGAETVAALAQQVVKVVGDVFGHALASIYLLDEDGRGLHLAACADPDLGMPESLRMNGPGLTVLAARTAEVVHAPDVSAHPDFVPCGVPLGSELLIPLKVGARVVGVLGLQRIEKGPFRPRDIAALKAFAGRAAMALEKAWIHERLEERTRQLEELHALAIMMVGDPAEAYAAIARQVSELLRTPYSSVVAVEGDFIRSLAIVSQVDDQPGLTFPLELTPCGVVVQTRDAAIFRDIGHRFPEDPYLVARGIKTYIAVPVFDREGRVVGVVNAMDRRERNFGDEDLRILHLLARRAGEEMGAEGRQREKENTQRMLLQSEKLAALGQVVAGVAHELNNPLASVLGFSELLARREDLPVPARAAVAIISAEAERARKVVRNLLAFAREHEPERSPTNVNDVLRRTLALRASEMRLSHVDVVEELAEDLPATLADAHLLQQAFLNLILNAEQAMIEAHGRGRLVVRSTALPEGTRRQGPTLRVDVYDDGPGIPPEALSRVFEPFYTTKPVGKGTGLGLSLTFSIIEQHHGTIWVESRPETGAHFVVEVPLVELGAGAASRASEPVSTQSCFAGCRILLVDDEAPLRGIGREVFEQEGGVVEEAATGRKALELLGAQDFDLVVCDVRMPDVGGLDVYRLGCRSRPCLTNRFLFVTGDVASGDTALLLQATGCAYLEKPYHVHQLIAKAAEVLHRDAAVG